MTRTPHTKYLQQSKLCPCGGRAVRYSCGVWSCQPCIDKDRAIYATARIRGSCGFPGAPDPYPLPYRYQ